MLRILKLKTESKVNEKGTPILLESIYGIGWNFRVCSIWYGGQNPEAYLRLFDSDKDMFYVPIPGQQNEPRKTSSPDIPIPIKLPLFYLDGDIDGGNEIIIWGEVYRDSEEVRKRG